MSPNKKPVFYVAIALCALILLPALLWLGSLAFRSQGVVNGPAPTLEHGNGQSGNPVDFALRKLADRAQSLVGGPLAEAAQSGDIALDSVLYIKKTQERQRQRWLRGIPKSGCVISIRS